MTELHYKLSERELRILTVYKEKLLLDSDKEKARRETCEKFNITDERLTKVEDKSKTVILR